MLFLLDACYFIPFSCINLIAPSLIVLHDNSLANLIAKPNLEYFIIVFHCTSGETQMWPDCIIAGNFYCCFLDKISSLELPNMAKELDLGVKDCMFSWLDFVSDTMGVRKITNDVDALAMACYVDFHREMNFHAKVRRVGAHISGDVVTCKKVATTEKPIW